MIRHQMQRDVRINTLLRLGQGHTYAPLRPDEVNSPLRAEDQLRTLARMYETLAFVSHPSGSPSGPPFICVVETLHLTLAVRPGLLSLQQILDYDAKLSSLGCRLIFIQVSPQTLWQRCIWERRKNGFITIYSRKYGGTLEEIFEYYVGEQQRMLELFERSRMRKLLIDGDTLPEAMSEKAYKFWVS
jgi:hypothetical protein